MKSQYRIICRHQAFYSVVVLAEDQAEAEDMAVVQLYQSSPQYKLDDEDEIDVYLVEEYQPQKIS